jgi:hypothetical protein
MCNLNVKTHTNCEIDVIVIKLKDYILVTLLLDLQRKNVFSEHVNVIAGDIHSQAANVIRWCRDS